MSSELQNRQTFLANIRHDLRTPLNAVIGYSDILLEDCEVEDPLTLVPDLQKILEAGHQILETIGTVLQSEKILADETVEIEEYVRQIVDEIKKPLQEVIDLSGRLHDICADAGEEGWAKDLRRIRVAAQHLIHLSDDLQDPSRLEEMASAVMRAPVDGGDTLAAVNEPDVPQVSRAKQRPLTGHILIVDDNKENQDILTRHLKRQGHRVTVFNNGTAALEFLHQEETPNIDILLLDVMMTGMSGFQVLTELRKDSQLQHIPVIFLSALDDMESLLRGIELGAQDFLPKPFNPVLLKARIGATLEKKKLRDLELNYVANAARITQAAAAFEAGEFVPEILDEVAQRTDELGRLARVFQNMAYEVRAREERLKQEVQQLRIEIDRNKEATKVAEIVETEYFQQLQQRATKLRQSFKEK